MHYQTLLYLIFFFTELAESSKCQLKPLSFGYYYGVHKKSYSEAFHCCEQKKLKLVPLLTLTDFQQSDKIRDALLNNEPIGPVNGLYFLTNPNNNQSFYYPKRYGGHNETVQESCSILYLTSPKNISLTIVRVPCESKFRFLCVGTVGSSNFNTPLCETINYTELIEDSYLYSHNELEWRAARDCCEIKGGELYRSVSTSDNEDLFTALVDNAIIANNGSISFWAGGLKKLEKSHFTWSNYEHVLIQNVSENSEFCIKGTAEDKGITLIDYACENPLNSICRIKAPKRCSFVNMKQLMVNNNFRNYYYSDSYKLPWAEAVLCCRDKGMELLSVISPQEGNALAAFFQTSSLYHYRHQGFPYGIWTSGRRRKDSTYEFVAVKTKTKFKKSAENHFIQSPNGTCLQYIIDSKNSYFLNNIMCKSIRSFICEQPEKLQLLYNVPLDELGNKYFFSKNRMNWASANDICQIHKMTLLNLNNFEEKIALIPVFNILESNITKANSAGFWSLPSTSELSADFNPVSKKHKKTIAKKKVVHTQKLVKLRRGPGGGNTIEVDRTVFKNCSSTSLVGEEIASYNNDCGELRRFICEKQDPKYGMCDTHSFTPLGNYLFHSRAATWTEARKCCDAVGRSLITLTDRKHKRKELFQYLQLKDFQRPNIGVWTSGTNSLVPEKWVWQGTYEFLTTNIFYNDYTMYDETIVANDDHQCLEAFANRHTGHIVVDHEDCDIPKPFICSDSKKKVVTKCENIKFRQLKRTGFYYSWGKVKWLQSLECCKQRGMTLVEVPKIEDGGTLFSLVSEAADKIHDDPNFGFWVGLTSHISNHTSFTWTDSLKSFSWDPNVQPTSENACVQANTGNTTLTWKPVSCSKRLRFVCQIKTKSLKS